MSSSAILNLLAYNGSAAAFRAWGNALASELQAIGMVKTSDTGQIDWTSVSYPTASSTSMGYEIYRFNDSLQSSVPVYFKIEYGSSISGSDCPCIWITVGTGSDGSGNITEILLAGTALSANNYNASQTYPCRIIGSSNRMCFFMWFTAQNVLFSLERTHSYDGTDTSDGLMVFYTYNNFACSQYLSFSETSGTLFPKWNSTLPPSGTGVVGNKTYTYPIRTWDPSETYPSINIFMYFSADLTANNAVDATMWDGSSISVFPTATGNSYEYYGGTGVVAMRCD